MAAVLNHPGYTAKGQAAPGNSGPANSDRVLGDAPAINQRDISQPDISTPNIRQPNINQPNISQSNISQPAISPIDSAQARLAASRARLRLALMPPDPDAAWANGHGTGRKPHRLGAMWRSWRRSMHGWPMVDLALDTAQVWWQRQPLRPVGELLAAELRATVLPLVRKHPLATVAAAAALGVLLVAGRPWRWPLVAKQMHRAPRHVGSWLTRQLGNASVQASLIGMLMMWARRPPAEPANAQPATQTSAQPTGQTPPRPPAQT